MKKILLFLAAITVAVSCTTSIVEQAPSVEESTQTFEVNVSASEPASRVDITDSEDGTVWNVTWSESDALSGFSVDQTVTYSQKFSMASYDEESSTFSGNMSWYSTTMRLFYPYAYALNMDIDTELLPLSLAAQTIEADFTNLSSTSYMLSNQFDIEEVSSSTSHSETPIYMSHVGTAVELKIKFANSTGIEESDYTISQIVLGDEQVGLPVAGNLSIDDGSFTTTTEGAVTLSADGGLADVDGIYTARFNLFPTEGITGSVVPVEVTVYDAEGLYYTASATITAAGELARATKQTLYVVLGELTASEVPQPIFEITTASGTIDDYGSTSTYTGEMEIDGAMFYMSSMYTYYSYVTATTNGYLYNLTSFEGMSQIVITYKDSNAFDLYVGSSVNPLSTLVTPTIDGYVYTYDIEEGNTFFTIVKSSTSYVNASSIAISYDSLGDVALMPAQFTGLNPAAISFESDATDAVTVTLEGSYLANATTITASIDDDSYFTISDEVADDFTFTVTPRGANDSDEQRTATVTVSVDGVEQSATVTQLAQGIVNITSEKMIEALGASTPAASAAVKITDAVFSGFTITSDNGGSTDFRVYNSNGTLSMRSYSNNEITFAAAEGKAITYVAFGTSTISSATCGVCNGKSWSGNNSEVTLTMEAGTNYLITVHYADANEETDATNPEITSLSPSELTFITTNSQTVTILGYNLTGDFDLEIGDTTYFDIDVDGVTLTVTPKGENATDEDYVEAVSINISGSSDIFYLQLTQEPTPVASNYSYVLIEDIADITDGEYLLASTIKAGSPYAECIYIADGSAKSSVGGYFASVAAADYYDSDAKSFVSNEITDAYVVTIESYGTGYSIKLQNDTYPSWSSGTSMSFITSQYQWNATEVDNLGILLITTSTTTTNRYLGYNVSNPRFSTYNTINTSYAYANLYKKVEAN